MIGNTQCMVELGNEMIEQLMINQKIRENIAKQKLYEIPEITLKNIQSLKQFVMPMILSNIFMIHLQFFKKCEIKYPELFLMSQKNQKIKTIKNTQK